MTESLATRVGRIVSGTAHALVAALENASSDAVMDEAVREVDQAIDEVRTELGRVLTAKHLASTRLMEENRRHEELTGRLEVALGEGRDDLAEAAVAQQLDIEAQIPVLERTLADCGDREKELESYLAALAARKREMRAEQRELRRAEAATDVRPDAGAEGSACDSTRARVERAHSAFERAVESRTGLPGRPAGSRSSAQLAELETLERRHRIRERLEAARARLAQ